MLTGQYSATGLISATFTRPNDTNAYAAGDAVTNSTSAPVPITFTDGMRTAGSGLLTTGRLIKNANTTTNASFRLWLFRSTITPPNDNAAFQLSFAQALVRLGYIDFTTFIAGSDCAEALGSLPEPQILLAGVARNLFGLLQAQAAYTPAALEQFTLELGVLQD